MTLKSLMTPRSKKLRIVSTLRIRWLKTLVRQSSLMSLLNLLAMCPFRT